ncbi:MAG TPA: shikimate dehydrogenase [Acidimicrobiales bacterium]|nr:shikimate dehydrogenase [Acidimicrobiales bacterium]
MNGCPPLSGATRLCALIGDPVAHSLSPLLHEAAYAALGVDLRYLAFSVAPGEAAAALSGAAALGLVGLSVTTPHKDGIAAAADTRSAVVERLGAANTVVFRQGLSVAESTDGPGLLDDLARALSFSPAGARCAVLGAGGAARGVVVALADGGAESVLVVNRTPARARTAAALAGERGRVGEAAELGGVDLVVNATSLALQAGGEAEALGASLAAALRPGQLAVDLAYHPARSPFLAAAATRGATVRNGLGMLVHQAARQVELFTGGEAPVAAMWAAVGERPTS